MKGNKEQKLTDRVLKEALHRDIESIEPPPSEKVWQRIEAGLGENKVVVDEKDPGKHKGSFNWFRYGTVAAAAGLVLLILNSVGVLQWDQITLPAMLEDVEETVDEPAVEMETDEAAPEALMEEEVAEEAVKPEQELQYFREADPAPPEWPSSLPGDFNLDNEILLTAGESPDYQAAVYSNDEESLLLVKSSVEDEAIRDFNEHLSRHLEIEYHVIGDINGYKHIEVNGRPGLIWEAADLKFALLVKFGTLSPEELKTVSDGIE